MLSEFDRKRKKKPSTASSSLLSTGPVCARMRIEKFSLKIGVFFVIATGFNFQEGGKETYEKYISGGSQIGSQMK